MYTLNSGTEANRSYRYLPGAAVRLAGDPEIRKVIAFRETSTTEWTEASWSAAAGSGGVLIVYPALMPAEISAIGSTGTLTTGITTQDEAAQIVLWESWPADSESRVTRSFFTSPIQDYLGNKLGDNFHWLPFYHLLEDPGAPGKLLHEESTSHHQIRKFVSMLRDSGEAFWEPFATNSNTPETPPSRPSSGTIFSMTRCPRSTARNIPFPTACGMIEIRRSARCIAGTYPEVGRLNLRGLVYPAGMLQINE